MGPGVIDLVAEEVAGFDWLDDDATWRDAASRLLLVTEDQPRLLVAIALAVELPNRLLDVRAAAIPARILGS
jgi:hypothetical protein